MNRGIVTLVMCISLVLTISYMPITAFAGDENIANTESGSNMENPSVSGEEAEESDEPELSDQLDQPEQTIQEQPEESVKQEGQAKGKVFATAVGSYGVDLESAGYKWPINPYSSPECTWYCCGRAYEKLGLQLPQWHNAKEWDENAASQYQVGLEPRANSIMVENSEDPKDPGHVMFVEKVEDGYAYITECNYLPSQEPGKYNEDRINLATMRRDKLPNTPMAADIKYIYLRCLEHTWDKGTVTRKESCKNKTDGEKLFTCTVCGETKTETIPWKHSYKTKATVKATLLANGVKYRQCTKCNHVSKITIYRVKTFKLSGSKFIYTGKSIKPKVTVKNTKGDIISPKYYTISYSKNKSVGKAKVQIKLKGNYSGKKDLYFKIFPKGTSISKTSSGKKKVTIKWKKKKKNCSGYQVRYSKNSKFKNAKAKTIKGKKKGKCTIEGLTSGTKYHIQVRVYYTVGKTRYYSKWSKAKTVKTNAGPAPYVKLGGYILSGYGDVGGPMFEDTDQYVSKAGKYYMWAGNEYPSGYSNQHFVIRKAKNMTGTRTKIKSFKDIYVPLDGSAISNGKTIYYTKGGVIYRTDISGKATKKIFNTKKYNAVVSGRYGNNLYYTIEDVSSRLMKYDLKTHKKKTVMKNRGAIDSNGRYMICAEYSWMTNKYVYIYDCKTGKKKKLSLPGEGGSAVIKGSKLYYYYEKDDTLYVYSRGVKGGTAKLIFKYDSDDGIMVPWMSDYGIGFLPWGEETSYKYSFNTKTLTEYPVYTYEGY